MFVRRALDTGVTGDFDHDYVFQLDREFDIGYAYNDYANQFSWYTKHQWAGSVKVTLHSDGTPVWGTLPRVDAKDEKVKDVAEAIDPMDLFTDGASQLSIAFASALTLATVMLN